MMASMSHYVIHAKSVNHISNSKSRAQNRTFSRHLPAARHEFAVQRTKWPVRALHLRRAGVSGEKSGRCDIKRRGEPPKDGYRGIALPPLDRPQIGPIDRRAVRQLLSSKLCTMTQAAHVGSNDRIEVPCKS